MDSMYVLGRVIALAIEDYQRGEGINYDSAKHYLFDINGLEYYFRTIPHLAQVLSLEAIRDLAKKDTFTPIQQEVLC